MCHPTHRALDAIAAIRVPASWACAEGVWFCLYITVILGSCTCGAGFDFYVLVGVMLTSHFYRRHRHSGLIVHAVPASGRRGILRGAERYGHVCGVRVRGLSGCVPPILTNPSPLVLFIPSADRRRGSAGTVHGFAARPNMAVPGVYAAYQAALEQAGSWFERTL